MSKEDLEENGVNTPLAHVDFMVGTKNLEIIGVTSEGKEIQIFKDENFAF